MECMVYMGEVDMARQALNVFRMRLLGAEVRAGGRRAARTLKDAVNEAMRDWVATVETTHYCLGSVIGPPPYPWMVRDFHRVIGDEARAQCRRPARRRGARRGRRLRGRRVQRRRHLLRVRRHHRRARRGRSRRAARPWPGACPASCTACARTCCRTSTARCSRPSPSRPGSTTRGSGPSTPICASIGRARYETVTDAEVIDAFQLLSRTEGIIPALESAHALAWVARARRSWRGAPCS